MALFKIYERYGLGLTSQNGALRTVYEFTRGGSEWDNQPAMESGDSICIYPTFRLTQPWCCG